jgi:hypothetical protein
MSTGWGRGEVDTESQLKRSVTSTPTHHRIEKLLAPYNPFESFDIVLFQVGADGPMSTVKTAFGFSSCGFDYNQKYVLKEQPWMA